MGGRATNIAEFMEKLPKIRSAAGIAYSQAFRPRPDDVLIATFAKAGTTWMQQILHGLKTGGDMNFSEITEVVPWLELAHDLGLDLDADQRGGFRAFKTHLGQRHVPEGCRYISVIRDPRDSAVSFHNFMEGWINEPGAIPIDDFVREFYIPAQLEGGYWAHLMGWWAARESDEVLLLAFEDIKADHAGAVRRVADFLGLDLTAAELELATGQSTFEFMKRHERQFDDHLVAEARNAALGVPLDAGSTKVKSGRVGGHAGALSDATIALLDQKWAETVEQELGFASYAELRAAL